MNLLEGRISSAGTHFELESDGAADQLVLSWLRRA